MKKAGVSLIVLVITIIVMLILASTVAVSLNNANVIQSAKSAVCKTNLKQVQEIANIAWVKAYGLGERDKTKLKEAVDTALADSDIDLTPYTIDVTEDGVTVKGDGCEDIADIDSPDDNDSIYIDPNWVYAYTYDETNGWSGKIAKSDVDSEVTGKIVARLYETGEHVSNTQHDLPEAAAYKMVITGEGECSIADYENEIPYAWLTETIAFEAGDVDAFIGGYITDVEVGEGITSIGDMTFGYCSNIESITLPSTLNNLGIMSFYSCTNLVEITLPKSLTTVGSKAFEDSGIVTINYGGTEAEFNAISGITDAYIPTTATINYAE